MHVSCTVIKYIFFISSKFRRAYIIHTVSNYKENTTVINKRLNEFTEVTRKKEENGKTSHSYDKSQSLQITKLRSVSIKMTMATHFISQPTESTLSTDTISTPLRRHTTSEQRQICVDVTSFCNITVDTTPLRRCMLTELKQFILLNIIALLK